MLHSPTLPSGVQRLTYLTLDHKHAINENGIILMDVPTHSTLENLTHQAMDMDRATWNASITTIP